MADPNRLNAREVGPKIGTGTNLTKPSKFGNETCQSLGKLERGHSITMPDSAKIRSFILVSTVPGFGVSFTDYRGRHRRQIEPSPVCGAADSAVPWMVSGHPFNSQMMPPK
jgi:hypothetical protein